VADSDLRVPVSDPVPAQQAAETIATERPPWPFWQRLLFRFFSVYLVLQITPWDWFRAIPGVPWLARLFDGTMDWAVRLSNARLFHVRDVLVPVNGSGDTSYAWTQLWLLLVVAAIACVVWTILDRRRTQYDRMAYWVRLILRYYIASAALSYGIIKLFLLQMSFPALSQLATPLGDLLPMRFSWLFIGYSGPYQFFSGAMETIAGLLLLNRRTVTAGLFAATGAFMNVVMINLSYDVPVKLFASHLLFACLFLLALDSKRLVAFLFLNRAVPATHLYEPYFTRAWQVWARRAVKLFIVYQMLYLPLSSSWTRYTLAQRPPVAGVFATGVYDVQQFVVGHDTLPPTSGDSARWRDVVFDNAGAGSVNTGDTLFWQRYGRGYFRYRADTASRTAKVWKTSAIPRDSTFLFAMRYELPDTNRIRLHMMIRGDSVHVELVRVPRHFQLTERQFHWISEYNR
jgi:hypothetical protein